MQATGSAAAAVQTPATPPLSSSASMELASKKRVLLRVDGDVQPGTQVILNLSDDEKLCLDVPANAQLGDKLELVQKHDGTWCCHHEKAQTFTPASLLSSGELVVTIPDDVTPGVTQLDVNTKQVPNSRSEFLRVTVPTNAIPGDGLILGLEDDGAWHVKIVRPSPCLGRPDVALRHIPVEPHEHFLRMVDIATAQGAWVNPKLIRGVSAAGLVGMLAEEAIKEGEDLIRMPFDMHLSLTTCNRVMPELCKAVRGIREKLMGREDEVALAACLTRLILAAAAAAEKGGLVTCMGDAGEIVPELWMLYARALLAERFESHPYLRSLRDMVGFGAVMKPSVEHEYMCRMAGDSLAVRRVLADMVATELLGPDFDAGAYLHARLSTLTRVFHLATRPSDAFGDCGISEGSGGESSLVPIVDFFNHSNNAGAAWRVEHGDRGAMVIFSKREHAAGEEVFISYGQRSNVMLFRTYGFTLCPSGEPSLTFVDQHDEDDDRVWEALTFRRHLPESHRRLPMHLEVPVMQKTLRSALTACKTAGGDPWVFLRELCDFCARPYEADVAIRSAIDSLRKRRAEDPTSLCWWRDGSAEDSSIEETKLHALRVKMSEYLCLTTYSEALDLLIGQINEDRCLAAAVPLAALLRDVLNI